MCGEWLLPAVMQQNGVDTEAPAWVNIRILQESIRASSKITWTLPWKYFCRKQYSTAHQRTQIQRKVFTAVGCSSSLKDQCT